MKTHLDYYFEEEKTRKKEADRYRRSGMFILLAWALLFCVIVSIVPGFLGKLLMAFILMAIMIIPNLD
jgi:hypothetical protein